MNFDASDCFWSMVCRLDEYTNKLNDDDIKNKKGVYAFVDINDRVIRVGKAVKLRNRILQYYSNPGQNKLINLMRDDIFIVKVIYTNSERESMNLEYDLIKKYKPIFNNHNNSDNYLESI